ncbi:MAG TPA: hypothetical protein DD738_11705 [Ruminiclostridium sp.]|nr:hypothetical protein [Ruminiclostridium sp.]
MQYLVRNIIIPLSDMTPENEWKLIRMASSKHMGISERDIRDLRIVRESIDARKKNELACVYSVLASIDGHIRTAKNIQLFQPLQVPSVPAAAPTTRPVIIGAGPCGLFCAFELAERGFLPIIVERGEEIEKRTQSVKAFWTKGILNPESNVQFGEGGAGTFSDGKLTTRINDPRCTRVLEIFHACGAPEEILYKARPHIGTDVLKNIMVALRKKLTDKGAEFLFSTRMDSLLVKNDRVRGVKLSDGREIDTPAVVLAIGHSARDTFAGLCRQGIQMQQKPFSVGVRIEHLQEWINEAQYGKVRHFKLGAADYQLYEHLGERTAYSFCMCPGGIVVAAASEENSIVTNGMSYHARNGINANSAYVVSVSPSDFGGVHPLAGMEYQRRLERSCYKKTEGKGAPVQKLSDFLNDVPSRKPGTVKPSYTGETVFTSLSDILPSYVVSGIKQSLPAFERKLKGFMHPDALLTAIETRTSSPVRMMRNDLFQSVSMGGLFPAGEGAGYAGGIVSAAVDGIRVAEQVARKFASEDGGKTI